MNADVGPPPRSVPMSNTDDVAAQRLIVVVGNADFEFGLTRLELNGTGTATILNQRVDDRTSFEGRVPPTEAQAVLRSLPSAIGPMRRTRRGIPDEALYRIEQLAGEKTLMTVEVWESQVEASPAGRKLIEVLRRIVADVTDSQVVL